MERQVFRGNKVGIWIGVLAALFPLGMATLAVAQWLDGGIKVNRVIRHDFAALVPILVIFTILFAAGLAFLLAMKNVRAELDDQGITFFGFLGKPTFEAPWQSINSYRRGVGTWHLSSKGKQVAIPNVDRVALLHSAIVKRLPEGALKSEKRPIPPGLTGPPQFQTNMKSGKNRSIMFFSVLWYGFVAFSIYALFFLVTNPPKGAMIFFVGGVLAILAIVPFSAFKRSWSRYFQGSIEADENGITTSEGHIRWPDVRMVEHSITRSSRGHPWHKLSIVTDATGVEITDDVTDFEGLLEYVYIHMPEKACVFP